MILTTKVLLEKICESLQVDIAQVKSKRRDKELVRARFLYYYIGHFDFNFYKKTLGKELYADHSCVIHGIDKINQRIDKGDLILKNQLSKVRFYLSEENSGHDTILEKKYDEILFELMDLKRELKDLTLKLEEKDLLINKLKGQ
jgi:hypothetical protein